MITLLNGKKKYESLCKHNSRLAQSLGQIEDSVHSFLSIRAVDLSVE